MRRDCALTGSSFEISEADLSFYERVSPVFAGERYLIPPPTLCPDARLQRRLAFRNQIHIYRRFSSLSGEGIFSTFPENAPFPVYTTEEWWSDNWDSLSYGRRFDFSRPFFAQFEELRNAVPHQPLVLLHSENSEFCNNGTNLKDCYLVFNTSNAERCMYGENVWNSTDCLDCTHTKDSELCFDCIMCTNCYNVQGSAESENCSDSYFLLNCRSCSDCYGCVNLRRKQFCVFNRQFSKDDYEEFLGGLRLDSFSERARLEQEARAFWLEHPRPHAQLRQSPGASGNYISNSFGAEESYFIRNAENVRFCLNLEDGVKDSLDYSIPGIHCELMYESAVCGIRNFEVRFSFWCHEGCVNLLYCWMCFACEDCFGCVGLRKKRYCIFNQQYSKEDYELLVPRIIIHMRETAEWGEFFPARLSPIPYNDSLAQRYFPLDSDSARAAELQWTEHRPAIGKDEIQVAALPDRLPESARPLTVRCAKTGVPFRITTQELELCRKLRAPLPRVGYARRMAARAAELGGLTLHQRTCAKSGLTVLTTFPPEAPWIIWDRDVYEEEFS